MVGQSELLPYIASRRVWSESIKNRMVIHFIDNDVDTEEYRILHYVSTKDNVFQKKAKNNTQVARVTPLPCAINLENWKPSTSTKNLD